VKTSKSACGVLFIQPVFCYDIVMSLTRTVFTGSLNNAAALFQTQPPYPALLVILAGFLILGLGAGLGYLLYLAVGKKRIERRIQQTAEIETERARQAERKRLNSIYYLITALTSSLKYQRVLENALDLSASVLGTQNTATDQMVSAVLLFSENNAQPSRLTVGCARRFTAADMRVILPGESGLLGETIEKGEPVFSNNLNDDPELGRVIALRPCRSIFCIPLQAGLDTYGVLLYAHPDPDYFLPDYREILLIVSKQAVIALQNAILYRDLEEEKERMMEIQEEARKKLARDLHDGPTQSVAAIAMRLNFARRLIDQNPALAQEEFLKLEELARHTTKEIRHMLFTLRPLVLESQGLIPALEAMAEKMKETYGQTVLISADPEVIAALEIGKQAVIFYIVEEAVSNARKHAQADQIQIRLRKIGPSIALLEIQDNGVGFNVGVVDALYDKLDSLGMVNMRERAELINGVIRIDSAEGKGTNVQVAIPLTEEAVERLRSRT
jgi:signal transduction histidine kinase